MTRHIHLLLLACVTTSFSLGQAPIHALDLPAANGSAATTSRITVDVSDIRNTIPATLFGSCMEDVNHEIYGGLYAQLIMGESFEEPASGVNYASWTKHGGYWAADREYNDGSVSIVPGRHTRRMVGNNDIDVEPDGTAKLIYNVSLHGDVSIDAELRFLQARGNGGGVVLRASNEGIGENALCGYEIRLDRQSGKLQLIKHRNNSQVLAEADLRYSPDGWNRLHIVLKGNVLAVYLNAGPAAALTYADTDEPILDGSVGLATAGSPVSFRDIHLTAEGVNQSLLLTNAADQQVSDRWDLIESRPHDGRFMLTQRDAYNGLAAQVIQLTRAGGKAGIANRGLNRWGIAVEKGATYAGSCYLHTGTGSLPVVVALESADGRQTYARQTITVSGAGWKKYPFSLLGSSSDPAARFAIYFDRPGKLYVDQVSLFPTGSRLYHGLPMRADIANALSTEGLSFMRYAGTMVNAPGYRFKKMVGPRADRPPYTGHWNEYATNGFGIPEFLGFCEAAHITSAFAINIEETAADAADMVDYLNGDTTTRWGKTRAADGHPQPYKARYIEIGNEEVFFEGDDAKTADHYIDRFRSLYGAIHAHDTAINLVISAWWRPQSANTEKIFKALDGKAAYWDFHVGGDDPNSGREVDAALTRMQALFHQWDPATTMQCAIFEENGGLHNMQRALGHATNLNAVRRHGDFLLTACPANALQPWLQNDNGWDQGQIFFTPDTVWGMPPFYVQQLAAANYLPFRVRDTTVGPLDVTATRDASGRTLVLHIVNTTATAVEADIHLDNWSFQAHSAKWTTIAAPLTAENGPGDHPVAGPIEQLLNTPGKSDLQHSFPPYSYTVVRIIP